MQVDHFDFFAIGKKYYAFNSFDIKIPLITLNDR